MSDSYSYHWSQEAPYVVPGDFVKIFDTTTFSIETDFAAALATIEPTAMRELH